MKSISRTSLSSPLLTAKGLPTDASSEQCGLTRDGWAALIPVTTGATSSAPAPPGPRRQLASSIILHMGKLEEVSKSQSIAVHLDTRDAVRSIDIFRLQQVRAPDENASRTIEKSGFCSTPDSRRELVGELLQVRRRMQAQNHQIACDSLQPPVLMDTKQLPNARQARSVLRVSREESASRRICPSPIARSARAASPAPAVPVP